MTFSYFNKRSGDTYEITYDETTFAFLSANRYVDGIGRDPIYYDTLAEVPPSHRSAIEHILWSKQQKLPPPSSSNDE